MTAQVQATRVRLPRQLSDADRMRLFRRCLEALAEPGTIRRLADGLDAAPGEDGVAVAAAPMLVLSDLMCPLAPLPGDAEAAAEVGAIAAQTHAPVVALEEARFALGLRVPDPDVLRRLGRGTAAEPHTACTLFLAVAGLGDGGVELRLSGPGIDDVARVRVDSVTPELCSARASVIDFPLGVDLLLVDDAGQVLGLPRTTRVEVLP